MKRSSELRTHDSCRTSGGAASSGFLNGFQAPASAVSAGRYSSIQVEIASICLSGSGGLPIGIWGVSSPFSTRTRTLLIRMPRA